MSNTPTNKPEQKTVDPKTAEIKKHKRQEDKPFAAPHVNRKFAITVISIFVAMLLLPTVAWGVLKLADLANPAVMDTLDFDTGENRAFAEFPKTFDPQTVTSEIESWYNDHLPFRSVLYKTQQDLSSALERPYKTTVMPALIQLFHGSSEHEGDGSQGGEDIEDIFNNQSETEMPFETETLPEFETEDETPSDCQHVLSEESVTVKEATCSEFGVIGFPCTLCEYVGNKQYTQKIPHDYISSVKDLPICGTVYHEVLVCKDCKDRIVHDVLKKHDEGKALRTVAPTQQDYGYTLRVCGDCGGEFRTELKNKLPDTTYLPAILHNQTLEGKQNWLFYTGDDSILDYQGTNLLSASELASYGSVLQQLDDLCTSMGKKLVIGFFPNKEQVYSEYMPDLEVSESVKRVERLTSYLNTHTTVTAFYPIAEMKAAKPYWQVYYKHDTHWNTAGGYIGVQALYKALGYETVDLIDLPVNATARKGGDLINIGKLNSADYTGDVAYTIQYKTDVTIKNINPKPVNSHTTHYTSNGQYDLNFVMLSDSFRGGMSQYLYRDFTNCLLTHRSQVRDADVVPAICEADILVISAVERADQNVIATAKTVIEILTAYMAENNE